MGCRGRHNQSPYRHHPCNMQEAWHWSLGLLDWVSSPRSNPRHFQILVAYKSFQVCLPILDAFKSSLPSNPRRLQILAAFNSSPLPSLCRRQIVDAPKSLMPPDPRRFQFLATLKSSPLSDAGCLQILAISKYSPLPNRWCLQILDSSKPSLFLDLQVRRLRILEILATSKFSPFQNPCHPQVLWSQWRFALFWVLLCRHTASTPITSEMHTGGMR